VLVVDDSVVVRRLVSEQLARDPDLYVVGTAASGAIALAKLDQLAPDVITLDVAMDGMSGLETLERLRAVRPQVRVIMLSALTARGAEATISALLLGASDYVAKPSASGSDVASVCAELAQKIKAVAPRTASGDSVAVGERRASGVVDVVAIGLSTGGPNALAEVLPALPADFPVPVLVVQHVPPVFSKYLAQGLANTCKLRVEEALHGARVAPGTIWIAPGNQHLAVAREGADVRVRLTDDPPENSCRPAVDVMFRSVSRVFGPGVLGVVMTGMGQDGLDGARAITAGGGRVLAQDEESSVVWGMPGAVVRGGVADAVLPLDEIAGEIVRRASVGRAA
jgi:two-component system chemotaxis response regulator CheB